MNRLFCFLLVIWFCVSGQTVAQGSYTDLLDDAVRRGIRATILQDYKVAAAIFDSIKIVRPEDPRPYFYHAAALQSRMLDLEDYTDEGKFLRLIDETVRQAEKQISQSPESAAGYFFKGAALSCRGFYFAQRQDYLRGIQNARLGVKYLERAVQTDSTYYDAYLAIGFYKYWRSRLTQFIDWLPFVPDQTDESLRLINMTVRYGRYGQDVAKNGLIWLEINRGHFDQAIVLCSEMLEKYPDSRYFRWPLAESYSHAGLFEQAIREYQLLEQSYQLEPDSNHYNEVVCGVKIARAYYQIEQWRLAREQAEKSLNLQLTAVVHDRLKAKIVELHQIIAKCDEHISVTHSSGR